MSLSFLGVVTPTSVAALLLLTLLSLTFAPNAVEAGKSPPPLAGPIIHTTLGPIRGIVVPSAATKQMVNKFFGVPFAASPTGANRFRPPQPHAGWLDDVDAATNKTKVFAANVVGQHCVQTQITQALNCELHAEGLDGGEDCLNLNVYVPPLPSVASSEEAVPLLPVLVWIYGGGFTTGDNYSGGGFDGANLATTRNVIVVAMNYRVGAFGFLALDELRDESAGTTGNYGLQDQQMALRWVRDNARAFGGDPNRVTIFGQSAGGISVQWHLAAPSSRGLFSAAIAESGNADTTQFFRAYGAARHFSQDFATAIGCDTSKLKGKPLLACLRALPAYKVCSDLFLPSSPIFRGYVPSFFPAVSFCPVIDGSPYGTPDYPTSILAATGGNNVPAIVGTVHDEGAQFVIESVVLDLNATWPISQNGYNTLIMHVLHKNATIANIVQKYYVKHMPKASYTQRISVLIRDYAFLCPSRRTVRAKRAHGQRHTYFYQFTYKCDKHCDQLQMKIYGDYHASEVPFVFDNMNRGWQHKHSAHDQQMSDVMTQYWSNFAHTADPNVAPSLADTAAAAASSSSSSSSSSFLSRRSSLTTKLPEWPGYDDTRKPFMRLQLPPTPDTNLNGAACDMWDSLQPLIEAQMAQFQ